MQVLLLVLLQLIALSQQQSIYYVKPDFSSLCPGQPCHTVQYYASQGMDYFASGATFIFLSGSHNIYSAILLHNVSDVAFIGDSTVRLLYMSPDAAISCKNVTNFRIEGVTFISFGNALWKRVLSISDSKDVAFHNTNFHGQAIASNMLGGAVYINHSQVLIVNSTFRDNTGLYGGAIHASGGSIITLDGNSFFNNNARYSGGAIFVNESLLILKLSGNSLVYNSAEESGGALYLLNSKIHTHKEDSIKAEFDCRTLPDVAKTYVTRFSYNDAKFGGAMHLVQSSVSLGDFPILIFHNNSAEVGGAITSTRSNVSVSSKNLCISKNSVNKSGGAYFGHQSSLSLGSDNGYFDSNYALGIGGAIVCDEGRLYIRGSVSFVSNRAEYGAGGAILVNRTDMIINATGGVRFVSNRAEWREGGGIAAIKSNLTFICKNVSFVNNFAPVAGGGLVVNESSLLKAECQLNFVSNWAWKGGGLECTTYSICMLKTASYINNFGKFGGGAIAVINGNLFHHDVNITGNSDIAIDLLEANISFTGNVKINKNSGRDGGIHTFDTGGGAIRAMVSHIYFRGTTVIENNLSTLHGGAVTLLMKSTISFSGNVLFRNNSAVIYGGAVFASDSTIILNNVFINFTNNSAENGGALYFENGAIVTVQHNVSLTTSLNQAAKYGGAIYHSDAITPPQCEHISQEHTADDSLWTLPKCFIDFVLVGNSTPLILSSVNDSAECDGDFLYGGLLDKCQVLMYSGFI